MTLFTLDAREALTQQVRRAAGRDHLVDVTFADLSASTRFAAFGLPHPVMCSTDGRNRREDAVEQPYKEPIARGNSGEMPEFLALARRLRQGRWRELGTQLLKGWRRFLRDNQSGGAH